MKAVEFNRKNIVEFLVSKGANLNVKGNNKKTPLEIAIDKKYTDIAKLLIPQERLNQIDCKNGMHLFSKWASIDNSSHRHFCLICNFEEKNPHNIQTSYHMDRPIEDRSYDEEICTVCEYSYRK